MVNFIVGAIAGYLLGMYFNNQKFKEKVNGWINGIKK